VSIATDVEMTAYCVGRFIGELALATAAGMGEINDKALQRAQLRRVHKLSTLLRDRLAPWEAGREDGAYDSLAGHRHFLVLLVDRIIHPHM